MCVFKILYLQCVTRRLVAAKFVRHSGQKAVFGHDRLRKKHKERNASVCLRYLKGCELFKSIRRIVP